MLEARQEKILLAVIREYVSSAEPVGSSLLAQKYDLECSPATIRNELARLEELGYLGHPHTSAGRVPMDKAYRYYVDRLLERRIQPPPEASAIARELSGGVQELDDFIAHTVRVLAQTTQYTSVVAGPRIGRSLFKYLQLVKVGPSTILLVMMTQAGAIVHRAIEVSYPLAPEDLQRMTNVLNDRLRGLAVDTITGELLRNLPERVDVEILERVGEATRDLARQSSERVTLEGTSNLLGQPEFRDVHKARTLIEVLEQEKLVAEILEKSLCADSGVGVVIGAENRFPSMRDVTMVTATYSVNGVLLGSIGVIGPTRLPYERIISVVRFVADSVGRRLAQA